MNLTDLVSAGTNGAEREWHAGAYRIVVRKHRGEYWVRVLYPDGDRWVAGEEYDALTLHEALFLTCELITADEEFEALGMDYYVGRGPHGERHYLVDGHDVYAYARPDGIYLETGRDEYCVDSALEALEIIETEKPWLFDDDE